MLRGLAERRVKRVRQEKRETEDLTASLLLDLRDNQDCLDNQETQDHQLIPLCVTLRKEPPDHQDLQGYKEKRDRKVTEEIPVFSVKALVQPDYQDPRDRKEREDLLVQLAVKETRVSLAFLDHLEDLEHKEYLD